MLSHTHTVVSLSALGLMLVSGTALGQSVVELPSLGGNFAMANDINDSGVVVGQSSTPGGLGTYATKWDASHVPTNLGAIGSSTLSEALAINVHGAIVGLSEDSNGFRSATLWDELGGVIDVNAAIGSNGPSVPWHINDAGVIVGQASINPGFAKGFLWDQKSPARVAGTDLYMGGANYGINNDGAIVGSGFFFGDPDDALLAVPDGRGGYDYPLINPAGFYFSQARAISNNGMIIGHSGYNSTSAGWNACIFTGDDRDPVVTLGTLPNLDTSDGADVNDNGMVVGYAWDGTFSGFDPRAWVWVDGTMYDLNDLLDEQSAFEILSRATGVNNHGDIVGWGRLLDGSTGAFLIEGFTPPSSCAADMNGDGNLDFFDVSAFLTAFTNQDASADFTNDGHFDFFDVSAFLGAFSAGCP